MYKKLINYGSKHVELNGIIHLLGGIALGMIIMYFLKPQNPLAWIGIFIGLSVIFHIYIFLQIRK